MLHLFVITFVLSSAPRVSCERIISGLGIPRIYDFFCHLHPDEVNEEVQNRIRTEDAGKVIAEYAENGKVRTIAC